MERYDVVLVTRASNWEPEVLGTANDSDIAELMVEGLVAGFARRLDLHLAYGACTRGIAGGVIAGIELYDYATDEVAAVVGYTDNEDYEEDEG